MFMAELNTFLCVLLRALSEVSFSGKMAFQNSEFIPCSWAWQWYFQIPGSEMEVARWAEVSV